MASMTQDGGTGLKRLTASAADTPMARRARRAIAEYLRNPMTATIVWFKGGCREVDGVGGKLEVKVKLPKLCVEMRSGCMILASAANVTLGIWKLRYSFASSPSSSVFPCPAFFHLQYSGPVVRDYQIHFLIV